ncbi:MAG: carbonic anhydrase [Proteobacteria bacterium]|nr:carbonic anhydrase [Pseudomonadota bacterium]MBI3498124.1 carbonic anhydrase [Pseudomonadota bacterium]
MLASHSFDAFPPNTCRCHPGGAHRRCEAAAVIAGRQASDCHPSRRHFLRTSLAGAAAGALAGVGIGLFPRAAQAQNNISPDAALQQLMDGNQRFAEHRLTSFEEDLALLKQMSVEGQAPFASVLSCADSRVPVELVFDQTIGRLFVARVAGNIATAELIASLEYGAAVLGSKAIVVMGHSSCGAVKATISGKPVPGQISVLYRYIRPAVDQAGTDLEAVSKANAKIQARLLRESSPVLAELIKKKQLKVVAAYYDVATGKVAWL